LQERIFEKLFTEAEVANLTPKDMDAYEESLKVYRDNYSILETAKREGRQEGIQEGKKEGIQEGIQEVF
jgi:predicted transposase YdaD